MRNLKRALALVMATAMLLGMMVTGAGASYETFTDSDDIVNTEAVETMVSLGVISGRDTGEYDPTGIVTRGEMAKLIAVSLNGGTDPLLGSGASTTAFTDTTGHWAEAYIAYCANLGIINGYGDGTFGPDDTVTGTAAAKMFLTALGYMSDIEGLTGTGWDLNTDILANKVGLYNELSTMSPSEGMTRDNVAQLIYNGVQAQEVVYQNNYGEYSGVIYAMDNGDMLSNRFGVLKVTGIVVANDKMELDTYSYTSEGKSRINVTAISNFTDVADSGLNTSGSEVFEVEADDYLVGQEVVLYVKFLNELAPNATSSTVLGDLIVTDNNVVIETDGRLEDTDDVKSALRDGDISMPTTDPDFYYYSGLTAGYAGSTDGTQDVAGVAQRFIDNTGDGKVDLVIAEVPTLTKVSTINTSDEKITFSNVDVIEYDDLNGYEDLEKDDYVMVTLYDNGITYVTLAEYVEAEVTAYVDDTVDTITADGVTYKAGAGLNKAGLSGGQSTTASRTIDGSSMLGNTYALYLDAFGNLLAYDEISTLVGNYAVVLGTYTTGTASMGYSAQAKVILSDGTTGTYYVDLANTAVKLGLASSSDSTTDKEGYVVNADSDDGVYFDTDSGVTTGIVGELFSYSIGDDGYITLANPNKINDDYNTATFGTGDADGTLYSYTSSYAISNYTGSNDSDYTYQSGASSVVADDNTVFFFENGSDDYSVVIGLSALTNSGIDYDSTGDNQAIFYVKDNTTTKVAKAVVIDATYAGSSDYAFITTTPSETLVSGTTYYVYSVIFEDNTTGTLTSTDYISEEVIVEYDLKSNGYYDLTSVGTNARVDYVSGTSLTVTSLTTGDFYDALTTDSDTVVVNADDTSNSYFTSLGVNDKIAYVEDANNSGLIDVAFIYDVMFDETAVGATLSYTDSSDAAIVSGAILAANDVINVAHSGSASQTVTITLDTGAGSYNSDTGVYTVAAGDLGGTVTFKVVTAEDNKNSYTTTVDFVIGLNDAVAAGTIYYDTGKNASDSGTPLSWNTATETIVAGSAAKNISVIYVASGTETVTIKDVTATSGSVDSAESAADGTNISSATVMFKAEDMNNANAVVSVTFVVSDTDCNDVEFTCEFTVSKN